VKELWKATEPVTQSKPYTLHLIDLGEDVNHRYVVCHNFTGTEWDWGSYFENLDDAVERFLLKATQWSERLNVELKK
jgi:hypothetical protein